MRLSPTTSTCSRPTSPDEELRRILPVVDGLARQKVPVSIDTRRAAVARAALDAGAVLMHRRGLPENTFAGPPYVDVVEEVRRFLLERAAACQAAGVKRERIALDPGIGFGKSVAQELELIAGAGRLADMGYPVLVGCSRKSFIGKLTGIREPRDRDAASVWLAVEATRRGAAIVRVHDVAGTQQALAVSSAMR